jgi:hypothetical protein
MTRIFLSLLALAFCLYTYLTEQNRCTEIKMKLPKVAKEIEAIKQVNSYLSYQIECFENPQNLLALASQPAFSHLKFPYAQEVMTTTIAANVQTQEVAKKSSSLAMFVVSH